MKIRKYKWNINIQSENDNIHNGIATFKTTMCKRYILSDNSYILNSNSEFEMELKYSK